jgi:DNA polymerase I
MKKLFLLDGHALVYRAHYAFITRPLLNSKGTNVSCISGFIRVLLDVIKREKPTHLAVSFDLPSPTFRHTMFEPYKANRDKQPEDISFGLPYIMQILKGMRVPILTADGYEADDVIGTLAHKAASEGFQVFMMTPDKDYGQLVSDQIFMYKPAKSGAEAEVWGVKEVCENWGISNVLQVIDMLGLCGDSVDNIPGIPGIGPKTAATLLEKYGTLENILANVDELKGKQQDNVRQFAEQGLLSKKLARIELEVPIAFSGDDCLISPYADYDRSLLTDLFAELEFRSLAKEFFGNADLETAKAEHAILSTAATNIGVQGELFEALAGNAHFVTPSGAEILKIAHKNIGNTDHTYTLVETPEDRARLLAQLMAAKQVCFDSETTSIDATQAELVGLSFATKAFEAFYVPVPAQPDKAQEIVELFRPFFENEDIQKIGQNLKYDVIVLKNYGVSVKNLAFDTMLAHYLLEPELRHNMNFMSETYLQYAPVSIETLIGKGKNQLSMRDIAVNKVADYAAEDADVTFQLFNFFEPQVKETPGLEKLFLEMEMPLVDVLAELESAGIRVDADYLEKYSRELEKQIAIVEEDIFVQARMRFNISSPKQVGEVLFDHLKLPYRWKKTGKTEQYSTDEEKLSELALKYPVARTILNYRSLTKLLSTYVDALPKMINPKTGRIHSSFNQALAATGRLSSNNPNLQNIPIRTAEGRRVREAFLARDENHVLLSADYSQIELRLIAEIAQEEAMLEAFQQNLDIHLATAAKVYNVPLSEVSAEQRRNAKTVNFSIIYGAGSQNLSQQLSIPRTEAKALIEQYFNTYKGLKNYMETVVEQARKDGFVTTLMGRRRYLRDIDSRNQLARSNAERVAVNSPVQGSAADMIKMAMIQIHKQLKNKDLKTKMVLQVHDELVFDVPKSELEVVKILVADCMKNAIPNLRVPIEVGIGVGDNWLIAH